jgi:uncharacterized protein YjbI with pentapeptide repeats
MDKKQSSLRRIKTFWGWLQFPVLFVLLLASVIWLHLQQTSLASQLEQQQRTTALQTAHSQQQETLLINYINTISDLLVHDKLLTSATLDPARVVAQAQTFAVLKQLDPDYKGRLMGFLYTTRLINNDHRILDLTGADLHGAHLSGFDLRDTYLVGANLSAADLRGSNLSYATLSYVNLATANLTGANLSGSEMHNVNLAGTNLSDAYMKDAFNLGTTQFTTAKSLSGATMPDGTTHR